MLQSSSDLSVFSTLKQIAITHRKKLAATFSLVAAENLLLLLYPVVGSFAVNAVLNQELFKALLYAAMIFVIWAVGSARRAVDTRVFVRIYAELAVSAVLNQKQKGSTSSATAHAALARQFVEFFEEHLPMLSLNPETSAGHIYAVITYLWSFAFSLDDMPRLVEKFSELKDIGQRVEV